MRKGYFYFVILCISVLVVVLFGMPSRLYSQQKKVSVAGLEKRGENLWLVKPRTVKRIITVGGPKANIAGYTSEAVQIAVDALANRGGGEVQLTAGIYEVMGPIRLASGISLTGAGETTILRKAEGYRSKLAVDGDYGMLKVTVKDVSGFKIGMGIMIRDSKNKGCWDATTAKITDIVGNTLYIDNYLARDYRTGDEGLVSNNCSVVEVVDAENVYIANLMIDGNGTTNDKISGCRAGALYLHKARQCVVENVKIKNFNGDGISWQITEDIKISGCEVHGCVGRGFHPGTGSVRSTVENCTSYNNGRDGVYLCWRVQNGIFRNNKIYRNSRSGISIGHQDTDNIFENNHIYENAGHGIYFRSDNEQNAGHRNTFRGNIVEDNGTEKGGYGFYVKGPVRDIIIEENIITDTGKGFQKVGVYIDKDASNIKVSKNQITGHKEADLIDNSDK